MNPEAQRIAIAESVGWADIYYNPVHGGWMGTRLKEDRDSYHLPDYLNDLNAMHEAEKILDQMQARTYSDFHSQSEQEGTWAGCHCFHQTAAQRAEAFLRTLNLWTNES